MHVHGVWIGECLVGDQRVGLLGVREEGFEREDLEWDPLVLQFGSHRINESIKTLSLSWWPPFRLVWL